MRKRDFKGTFERFATFKGHGLIKFGQYAKHKNFCYEGHNRWHIRYQMWQIRETNRLSNCFVFCLNAQSIRVKKLIALETSVDTLSKYSQTWANDHLRIATTCLQRPLFWGSEGGRCTQVWLYKRFKKIMLGIFIINIFLKIEVVQPKSDQWSNYGLCLLFLPFGFVIKTCTHINSF